MKSLLGSQNLSSLVIKLFGKYVCLHSFLCFYSVSIMFWQNLSTRQIVIIKWNTIIRMDEVCMQLVFTKFGELRFYLFFFYSTVNEVFTAKDLEFQLAGTLHFSCFLIFSATRLFFQTFFFFFKRNRSSFC